MASVVARHHNIRATPRTGSEALDTTRVVLVGLPRLLRDLIRAELAKDDRLKVAAESDNADDAASLVGTSHPAVLILGMAAALDRTAMLRLLTLRNDMQIVAVLGDGRGVKHVELAVRDIEATPAVIVRAILSRTDSAD
ncbi:hypothetical protein BH23GEM10_BH23GEM10_00050 [soil metagenome]